MIYKLLLYVDCVVLYNLLLVDTDHNNKGNQQMYKNL